MTNPQGPIASGIKYAPTILLAASVYDPETSITNAEGVREQLTKRVSITRNGAGHTSHYLQGETSQAMDRYLATGKLPRDGTVYKN